MRCRDFGTANATPLNHARYGEGKQESGAVSAWQSRTRLQPMSAEPSMPRGQQAIKLVTEFK
jgi:hypothetical protein